MNICCWAPSLYKASLEFITQYLNSLIFHQMRCWIGIISFKPKIVFLWRLFSSLSIFAPCLILSPVMLAGTRLTPVSDLFCLPRWKCLASVVLSVCLHVHTCVIAEVCIYEAIWPHRADFWKDTAGVKIIQNHSGLCRYEELKKYKKLNPNVQKFFPQAVPWELCACMFTSCACYSLTLCVCSRHLAPRRHCRQKLIWKHRYAKACNDNKFQIPFSRIILSSTSWNLLKIKIIQW